MKISWGDIDKEKETRMVKGLQIYVHSTDWLFAAQYSFTNPYMGLTGSHYTHPDRSHFHQ